MVQTNSQEKLSFTSHTWSEVQRAFRLFDLPEMYAVNVDHGLFVVGVTQFCLNGADGAGGLQKAGESDDKLWPLI